MVSITPRLAQSQNVFVSPSNCVAFSLPPRHKLSSYVTEDKKNIIALAHREMTFSVAMMPSDVWATDALSVWCHETDCRTGNKTSSKTMQQIK